MFPGVVMFMESTKIQPHLNSAMTDEPEKPEEPSQPSKGKPQPPQQPSGDKRGYFHIYKKGQGYWTRMGTVGGAALIGLLAANFLYSEIDGLAVEPGWTSRFFNAVHLQGPRGPYVVVVIFALAFAAIMYHLMNKPKNVDFLIATDSEMKKVNWTTKKELMGSTKVVIWFVFVVGVMLFFYDLFFQMLFYLLGVLKTPPFFLGH
jgi:preprotein translocase SecE subunit